MPPPVANSLHSLNIWRFYTLQAFQMSLANRFVATLFLFGKTVRLLMFLLFLSLIFSQTTSLAGFTKNQIIFFYLSFNLIDSLGQLFFREVYRFRPLIINGGFDFVLLKPVNPLVRGLLGGADGLDLVMLVFIIAATVIVGLTISHQPISWLLFIFLIINSLLIAAAFHIFVLGLGIITTSIDHLVMIYRDLTALMRIPVDLYIEPIRSLLTFVLPLGIMFTFPAKVIMGLLSWPFILVSCLISSLSLFLALFFWRFSLKFYQSASS